MENEIKKNFIYSFIYRILLMIIPFITAPYLSRTLGVEGIGIYSYRYSIVYYFILFTLFGIENYGNRAIAKNKQNIKQMSKIFWEIYAFQFLSGIIMLCIYFLYIYIFNIEYKNISILMSLFIVSAMLDVNWLFFGLEDFKRTIARNFFVKVGTVILIFIFVHNENDVQKYTFIMSFMTMLSQLLMWSYLRKKVIIVPIKLKDCFKHIKPNLKLFIPVIAVSIYKMMDKIMIGNQIGVVEVGYYENAEKIINIPVTIITALGTVMLPRVSNIVANKHYEKVKEYLIKSIDFIMFLSLPIMFGLIAVSKEFSILYFGIDFMKTGTLTQILALSLPFLAIANILRTQYIIPVEKDNIYIKSVIIGAISNFIFNVLLIPKFGSIGASVGTVIAEITVMIIQYFSVKKYLTINILNKFNIKFISTSLLMFIIILLLDFCSLNPVIKLLTKIFCGMIIYLIINVRYIYVLVYKNKGEGDVIEKN